jgi:hypothetical protein
MTVLPNGDLIVGGTFTSAGGVSANRIARWNGSSWSAVGATMSGSAIYALGSAESGHLVVGGRFTSIGGTATPNVTRLTTTCPATAVTYGANCIGSAGLLSLVATQLPWSGGTYQARASGLVPGAIAFDFLGLTATATPLASLHPAGGPGCDLLAIPLLTTALSPIGGNATFEFPIPNVGNLVGVSLYEQVVQFEMDPSMNILAINSSNGIALTIGTF